jgi:hypothetical protein
MPINPAKPIARLIDDGRWSMAVAASGAYAIAPPSKSALPNQKVMPVTKAILAISTTVRPQTE